MNWLGLDIGGANLKVADGNGFAASHAFLLWREPGRLVDALRALFASSPQTDHVAVTMTGELAECYNSKVEGVTAIIRAFETAADRRHTRIYLTNGKIVSLPIALREPLLAAASNWHALARFATSYIKTGCGLAIDIGSTTCDIIPLVDGHPAAQGTTDTERMIHGELVYTGIDRSPLCAVLDSVTWQGAQCMVADELFATMLDVYVTLGELDEDFANTRTADGRSASKEAARARLARSICADPAEFDDLNAVAMAEAAADCQASRISAAVAKIIGRLPQPPGTVVISGRGEFLARRVLKKLDLPAGVVSLAGELGSDVSACAPAHALAVLCTEVID